MKASETHLQPIIEGTKQYVVPLFQRPYRWERKHWKRLWDDLCELCRSERPRTHFIGSIVTMPTVSVPEGVSKYLLIDGQQRLTTIFILLTYLRDLSKQSSKQELADEINNTLLVNPYKKGSDYYKILPTQDDRVSFQNLVGTHSTEFSNDNSSSQILKAYYYFKNEFGRSGIDIETLKKVISNNLSVVSIVLDSDDNPYLVFESLNATGQPLTQADLIRNFFLMRISIDVQELIYSDYWKPMQDALGESLTEYIRHYFMRNGSKVKENEIYFDLKETVGSNDVIPHIQIISRFSQYYQKLLYPEFEYDSKLQKSLKRLNRIGITTAYPFLLNCYDDYSQKKLTQKDFLEILNIIENFMIRRFVYGVPSNRLNQIFSSLYTQALNEHYKDFIEGVKSTLQTKDYPKNSEFQSRFKDVSFYSSQDRIAKAKLILETIEESYGHREEANLEQLNVERIMPEALDDEWKEHLGQDWEVTHELHLNVIGNLTLTGYQSELHKESFEIRKKLLDESHLEINKYFRDKLTWTKDDIEWRSDILADMAVRIWPYFVGNLTEQDQEPDVTGKTPVSLLILGETFPVTSWRDVLVCTLDTLYELDSEVFEQAIQKFPKSFSMDKTKFRGPRQLKNGYFFEANLSARAIKRYCQQLLEEFEVSIDDWRIRFS